MAYPISRRSLLAAAAIASPVLAAEALRRRPNILFIMADDLGLAHLGCYGQTKIPTPHIDSIAKQGMKFEVAYAGSPVCAPSRSVLMTGLHTGHTPVRANSGGVPLLPEDVTVARVLREAGYSTAMFGKWGLGDAGSTGEPTKQGFDEYFGYLHQVHAHRHYPEYLWHNGETVRLDERYAPDVIADRACGFLRRQRGAERPFFCYCPFTLPHVELAAPPAYVGRFKDRFLPEEPFADPRPGYARAEQPKAMLAAMVAHLDDSVGRLLATLKENGLDDDTLVMFTSDNGAQGGYGTHPEFFNATAGLRGVKTEFYEGGLRVPFLARWNGRIRAGSTTDQILAFWDVAPTLAELAGAPPMRCDGLSLRSTLLGGKNQLQHEHLYWEGPSRPNLTQAVRRDVWKMIRLPNGRTELFNLADDPAESRSVAETEPAIVRELTALAERSHGTPRPQVEPRYEVGRKYR